MKFSLCLRFTLPNQESFRIKCKKNLKWKPLLQIFAVRFPISNRFSFVFTAVSTVSVIFQPAVGDDKTGSSCHVILGNRERDFVIDDLPASFTDQIDVIVKIALTPVLHPIELKSFDDAVP